MPEVDLFRYKLSEAEHGRIFQEEIVPDWLADAVPQRDPVVVLVGGQPGAGKTTTTETIRAVLDRVERHLDGHEAGLMRHAR